MYTDVKWIPRYLFMICFVTVFQLQERMKMKIVWC